MLTVESSSRVRVADMYRFGTAGLGSALMGKLGRAWDGAWVDAWWGLYIQTESRIEQPPIRNIELASRLVGGWMEVKAIFWIVDINKEKKVRHLDLF